MIPEHPTRRGAGLERNDKALTALLIQTQCVLPSRLEYCDPQYKTNKQSWGLQELFVKKDVNKNAHY